MKHCYWCGDAVTALFLRNRHSDFLLEMLTKCETVHTAECTVTEFRLAVAQATGNGKLKLRGGDALRAAFDDAVRLRRIILLSGNLVPPADELTLASTRPHLFRLDPLTVVHLASAKNAGFRYFVTCNECSAPLIRAWELRPVTPAATAVLESCKNRLKRCDYLFGLLQTCIKELDSESDKAENDPGILKRYGAKVTPRQYEQLVERFQATRQSFREELEEIESSVQTDSDVDVALVDWGSAGEEIIKKLDRG